MSINPVIIGTYTKVDNGFYEMISQRGEASNKQAYVDIVMLCSYQRKRVIKSFGVVVVLQPYQCLVNQKNLMQKWQWKSKSRVSRFLQQLENIGAIKTEKTKANNQIKISLTIEKQHLRNTCATPNTNENQRVTEPSETLNELQSNGNSPLYNNTINLYNQRDEKFENEVEQKIQSLDYLENVKRLEDFFFDDYTGKGTFKKMMNGRIIAKKNFSIERIKDEIHKFYGHHQDNLFMMQKKPTQVHRDFERWLNRDLCKADKPKKENKKLLQFTEDGRKKLIEELPNEFTDENYDKAYNLCSVRGKGILDKMAGKYPKRTLYLKIVATAKESSKSYKKDFWHRYFYMNPSELKKRLEEYKRNPYSRTA